MTNQLYNCYGEPITLVKPEKYGKGYAAQPGTGPENETCRTCSQCTVKEFKNNYYKCTIMEKTWTRGRATDILLRSKACKKWKGKANSS
jgi:hypothetical protein